MHYRLPLLVGLVILELRPGALEGQCVRKRRIGIRATAHPGQMNDGVALVDVVNQMISKRAGRGAKTPALRKDAEMCRENAP